MTESYGTGQDIDDRIVEGDRTSKILIFYCYVLKLTKKNPLSGLECSHRDPEDSNLLQIFAPFLSRHLFNVVFP